jgi:hypothetical protein
MTQSVTARSVAVRQPHARDPVRKTGAALIEQQEPPHRRQAVKEPGELRKLAGVGWPAG